METVLTLKSSASAYICEFNMHFQNSFQTSTALNNGRRLDESLLNRSLSLLSSSQCIEDFNAHQLENIKFYINLHETLNNLDKDSDLLWQSINILQLAIRNPETREALLYKFRYFPVLAKTLLKLTSEEKIQRLLTLMHDISYGIQIKWEEPYLEEVLSFLLKYCMDDEETTLGSLALSVLINLCYKNFPVICILIKTVNISNLSNKIKKYNILANKLLVILAKDISTPDFIDSSYFIKKSFMDCGRATQTWNVPYFRHIFEFLIDSKDNPDLLHALNSYTDYEQDIQDLVDNIESRLEMDDFGSSQENLKIIQTCFSLIFQFLNYILEMVLESKQKDQCSLQLSSKLLLKISEFAEKWFDCQLSGAAALKLFETIIKLADDTLLTKLSKNLKQLKELIVMAETSHNLNSEYIVALHKLILVLIKNSKTQKFVISSITEPFFDKIFQPIFNISSESELYSLSISSGDLSKYLSCLNILNEFSKISENVWSQKIKLFLEMHQIQFLLAKGLLSKDEDLCSLVLDLTKNAPVVRLSKYVCQLTISNSGRIERKSEKYLEIGGYVDRDNIISISRSCEEKLQALLDKISKTKFEHIEVSEIIELYDYQLDLLKKNKNNYTKKVEIANEEITQLSQENFLMTAELKKYQNMSFRTNFIQERLQNEIRDITKQRNVFSNSFNEIGRKIKDKDKQLRNLQKILDFQTAELATLRVDLTNAKLKEEKYLDDISNLKTVQNENITRIEEMKKAISLADNKRQETIQKLDEKDKELIKLSKLNEETRAGLKKAEKIIEHLENQISEKNEKIKRFEDELQESEETRKIIMSLMESKKPKRKA